MMKYLRYLALLFIPVVWLLWGGRRAWYARKLGLPPVRNRVKTSRNIPIPMPDGVKLMADHYAPAGDGDHPTILIRSPYGRGWEAFPGGLLLIFAAHRFAERGYHVLVAGTRGQFDSGGNFVPFINETADGLATVSWLRQQKWFNGQIGMWGNSYLGLVQWAIAGDAGPELQALVPVTTSSELRQLTFADGVFALELSLRWALVVAGTGQGVISRKLSKWQNFQLLRQVDELVPAGYNAIALQNADRIILGEPAAFFQHWLETEGRADDPYWQAADFRDQVSRTGAAVHMVAGWYDIFLHSQLADYALMCAAGKQPHLTIGPWGHQDSQVMSQPLKMAVDWFDAQLRGDKSRLRERPVRLFVMGAETWRELDSYPPTATTTSYYLQPASGLSRTTPTSAGANSRFTYDPADPTPSLGGNLFSPAAGRVDNAPLETRGDVLLFTSEPLATPMEIIGPVSATIYLKVDTPSADLFVRLNDVNPAGKSTNVCDGLARLDIASAEPDEAGALRLTVTLAPTAYQFRRGHRLRLLLAGGAHPRWARNPGTGEPVGQATQLLPQEHLIYHDSEHQSVLRLPVVPF
ncbi:MAG: CocE/NonD family hydrolase [Ardenticatenales bacterium]|nr:CocE/NonD family hydrolase [Ardenticatenales bacterium]